MMTQVRFYVGGMVQGGPLLDSSRPVSDEEWAGVQVVLLGFSERWTEYEGRGMWRGAAEPSRVYEVLLTGLPPARATVQRVARDMAQAAHQQAVLWTMQEVEGGMEG